MSAPHRVSEPNILYFGTPVVPISTVNFAPISSAFWLGWRCVLGLAASSQTTLNLIRNVCGGGAGGLRLAMAAGSIGSSGSPRPIG
ncbi:hypothetical protein WT67_13805 [Burkholderia stagnalis]|nr:hypothetical protein WT11_11925 [Burkholderia stagnalis]KVO43735.1 hypothetical protein WT17_13075 [Burkholderia stagnalis]KVO81763.1 hypothetical protein WT19_33595 [Burkholderia stagnalis]KVW69807.1 hypothetical protein WT28_01375 [Burkholderia stagnalis]KVW76663.1 hypothetical protein WT29_20195 [Burkholderia stagnalis]